MAKPVCTFCGEYEGILMDTNLDDGDTQVVCVNDLMMYGLSMAASFTSGMTKEQAETFSDQLDQIYANDPRGPKPPAKGSGRKQASKPAPEPAADGSQPLAEGQIEIPEGMCSCGSRTATGDTEKLVCDGCGSVLATAGDASG